MLERLLGDPVMMEHLGGPESPEAMEARHRRYLQPEASIGGVFAVVIGRDRVATGWVGYWKRDWEGTDVWEAGWSVLPEFQGRGIATAATALVIDRARDDGTCRFLHAFPAVDNVASNALCRRLGFELLGETEVEYPKGHFLHANDWRLDLFGGQR